MQMREKLIENIKLIEEQYLKLVVSPNIAEYFKMNGIFNKKTEKTIKLYGFQLDCEANDIKFTYDIKKGEFNLNSTNIKVLNEKYKEISMYCKIIEKKI